MRKLIPLLLLTVVTACDSGGPNDASGGGSVTFPTPSPTSSPVPTPTPTPPTSAEPANGAEFFASIATLYTVQPDIAACRAGTLSPDTAARVLASLNAIRAEHNLPAVTYANGDEAATMQSALMQAANGQLSHNPPGSWLCYTSAGAAASAQANLHIGFGSGLRYTRNEDILIGWLTDVDNLVANNIGHRRWLLYPWLSTVAYGRVAGSHGSLGRVDAAALKVINTSQATPVTLPNFVAYPYEDYPARYFASNALLSFGVIANIGGAFAGANASVDYSQATVSVRARGGATMTVSQIGYDNQGFGLPNNLQFAVAGLQNNVTYDVTIDRVNVGGALRSYGYFFRLVP